MFLPVLFPIFDFLLDGNEEGYGRTCPNQFSTSYKVKMPLLNFKTFIF